MSCQSGMSAFHASLLGNSSAAVVCNIIFSTVRAPILTLPEKGED